MSVQITPEFNPLRLPSDRRLNRIAGPSSLVIFGVTGDLSRKKLMPAVYDLANRGLLPPGFALVGFARRDWADQDFQQIVHDSVREHARTEFREEELSELVASGYARDLPVDAWGRPLRLVCPGLRDPRGFDVYSDGPDGLPGGLDRIE